MHRLTPWVLLGCAGCAAGATLDAPQVDERIVPRGISTDCGHGAWCFVYPYPTGASLSVTWSPGRDDVWFAGEHGTMLRYDGARWTGELAQRAESWIGLDGTSPSDVWAIDRAGVFHFDGKSWHGGRLADVTQPVRIVARASDDVWLLHGEYLKRGLMHHDGAGWGSVVGLPSQTTALVATTRNEVIAGGREGVFRYSGATWARVGELVGVQELAAASPTVLWATTNEGLFRADGDTWTNVAARKYSQSLAVCGADDVWIRGNPSPLEHWDGKALTPVVSPFPPTRLYCTRDGDLWISNQTRIARHRADGWWSPSGNDVLGPDVRVNAMWGQGPDDVFAVGGRSLLHFDGKTWSVQRTFEGYATSLTGTANDDLWTGLAVVDGISTTGHVDHFDGKAWSRTKLSNARSIDLVAAAARNDVWAIEGGPGETNVHRWNGASWSLVHTFTGLYDATSVVVRRPDDVWISLTGGLAHWDGTTWSTLTIPSARGVRTSPGPIGANKSGALWFPVVSGSSWRVMTLEGGVFRTRYEPIGLPVVSSLFISSVFPDDGQNTWLSSTTGLHRHDGAQWSHVALIDLRLRMWSAREGDVWAFGSNAYGSPVLLRRLAE